MKFGVAMFVTDEGIAPAPLGRELEERGFESLFVAEHSDHGTDPRTRAALVRERIHGNGVNGHRNASPPGLRGAPLQFGEPAGAFSPLT